MAINCVFINDKISFLTGPNKTMTAESQQQHDSQFETEGQQKTGDDVFKLIFFKQDLFCKEECFSFNCISFSQFISVCGLYNVSKETSQNHIDINGPVG